MGSSIVLLDRLCGHCVQCLDRPPLRLQMDMTVVLQHLPAEMAADRLNFGVKGGSEVQPGKRISCLAFWRFHVSWIDSDLTTA